jgi:hypothetical protein
MCASTARLESSMAMRAKNCNVVQKIDSRIDIGGVSVRVASTERERYAPGRGRLAEREFKPHWRIEIA